MANNFTHQYSEYRIRDVIDRLEGFRCSVGWGQLNEDLEVAIDCLEGILKSMKEDEPYEPSKPPHWIVTDHGFAGRCYKCSVCEGQYWTSAESLHEHVSDHCIRCKVVMDPNAIEYREAT